MEDACADGRCDPASCLQQEIGPALSGGTIACESSIVPCNSRSITIFLSTISCARYLPLSYFPARHTAQISSRRSGYPKLLHYHHVLSLCYPKSMSLSFSSRRPTQCISTHARKLITRTILYDYKPPRNALIISHPSRHCHAYIAASKSSLRIPLLSHIPLKILPLCSYKEIGMSTSAILPWSMTTMRS
jgi:hypothetical protein